MQVINYDIKTLTTGQSFIYDNWSDLCFRISSSGSYTIKKQYEAPITFSTNLSLGCNGDVETWEQVEVECVSGTLTIIRNGNAR